MQGVEGLIYDFTFLLKQFKLLGVILLDFFDLLLKTVKSLFKSLRQQLKLFVDNLFWRLREQKNRGIVSPRAGGIVSIGLEVHCKVRSSRTLALTF